jgi:hypothetical protein
VQKANEPFRVGGVTPLPSSETKLRLVSGAVPARHQSPRRRCADEMTSMLQREVRRRNASTVWRRSRIEGVGCIIDSWENRIRNGTPRRPCARSSTSTWMRSTRPWNSDNPELRGKPVAVGGSAERGVVAAASYEARRFGVRSAMPSVTAKRQCPDLIFVRPRFEIYKAISRQIREIFAEHSAIR